MPTTAAERPPVLAILAAAAVPVLFHLAIVETSHIRLGLHLSFAGLCKLGFVTASAVMHWSIYASLLASFALTLRPGHVPLITAMERRLHGDISAELAAYTRNVTLAWSVFFAVQLGLSVFLFCLAPLRWWSFFVNILDLPLVALVFAAEYMVRLRCLSDPPRHSLATIVSMVRATIPDKRKRPLARGAAEAEL
jgi:uncharacterized membrane protein